MKYIGEECFGCGKKFEKDDDVVVCPECGTPYHRACYKEAGECVNHMLHESGESWKPSVKAEHTHKTETSHGTIVCPKCGFKNNSSEKFCARCNFPLDFNAEKHDGIDFSSFYNAESLGFNPDENLGGNNSAEGATIHEVSQFIGSNTLYYIPLFKRMKDTGTKFSFNLICFFFPYFYFASRRMWLWAVLTALVSSILNIPFLLYTIGEQTSEIFFVQDIINFIYDNEALIDSLVSICNVAEWILKISCCIFANWLYYRFSVKSVCKIKLQRSGAARDEDFKEKGGVKPINILYIGLIALGFSMAIYFGVMFILTFMQQFGMM